MGKMNIEKALYQWENEKEMKFKWNIECTISDRINFMIQWNL